MHRAAARERPELDEWLRLLESASIPRIQYLLLETSERANRLRQTNLLVAVLTEDEREQMNAAASK